MAEDLEKIEQVFRMQDERTGQEQSVPPEPQDPFDEDEEEEKRPPKRRKKEKAKKAPAPEQESERDYMPVRQSHEYRSGCLGGIMYCVFILCLSVVLACLAWMAASDMLALNKPEFSATVTLPMSIFESETVDKLDENGVKTGTQRITHADMDYVADVLKEAGLIQYKWLFGAFCKVSHADTKVRPGEYILQSSFDYRALVQNMRPNAGSAVTVTITFPEGYTMRQIFLLLEEKGVSSYDDLMDAAANYNFNYSFLADAEMGDPSRLEGFLFPDTYEFYVGMQPASAINKFLETFHYNLTAEMLQQAQNLGMDMRQIVTIASMIEKEAANDAERGTISSVIYNRLNAGMTLGIDATILYIHPEHVGGPTPEMFEEDSLYNTRMHIGLPPTPICSPGLASLKAALSPESSYYYYYALDTETGTSRFFTNYDEFSSFTSTQNYG